MEDENIFGLNSVEPVEEPTLATTDEVIPAPLAPEEGECPCCGDSAPVTEVPAGTCSEEVCNYFGTLQESVTIVWRYHLMTKKYHTHIALHEYYEGALDIIDSIIEQWQGINGVADCTFNNVLVADGKDDISYLHELKEYVENNKGVLGGNSEINSTIDNLLSLIDSTIYKVTAFCESAIKSFEEFCYEDSDRITEACSYDRFGERSCDDPDDPDYIPDEEEGESCGESCGEEEE